VSALDDARDRWVAEIGALRREIGDAEASWISKLRADSGEAFATLGLPTTKWEEWRYTSLAGLARVPFAPAGDGRPGVRREDVERLSLPVFACNLFVFVDGRFAPDLSTPQMLTRDVHVESLAKLRREDPARIESRLGSLANAKQEPFVALNTALLDDGAVLFVPEGAQIEGPIHVVFLGTDSETPGSHHPRLLVMAGSGSKASVIQDHVSLGDAGGFTNAVTEVRVEQNAALDLIVLQRENSERFHVSKIQVHQERDSRFASHVISVGGGLVRNDLGVVLGDEGAECSMNGLFLADGAQVVDNHTLVDHSMPHGTSRQLYKGVLGGRARGIFRGRVIVRPHAQKTDATQSNANLLLSDDAEIDTKPQLEIYADDVKCSHGSSVGQLDADALFYLRSRGIDERAANDLLSRGFASAIAAAIPNEAVRDEVETLIAEKLGASSEIEAPAGKLP
jgi:Fe-S cluster assembly protein SufD